MKFYCTAGRGTETFLGNELRDMFKEKLLELTVTDGKVFFELADDVEEIEKVLQLKIAERAFVQVVLVKTSELDHRNLLNSIKMSLNNKATWNDSLAVIGMIHMTGKVDVCDWNQTNVHECKSISDSADEPVPKKARLVAGGTIEESDTTFRVNFKCPACFRKRLDIKSMPRQIGMHIKNVTGWKVDLRHPLNEICIQLNNEYLTVGIPLTREPLSKRHFIKQIGLRSTVAHIMVELLKIQLGDTVIDPMCGKATILLEAAHCFKNVRYIGIDKSESQLKSARENVEFAESDNIQLINGDTTGLPFPDGSIDKIVTDAPFGNTHTTDMPLKDFYRKILQEFSRVLSSPSGKLVILTSPGMKDFITETLAAASTLPSAAADSKSKMTCDSEYEHDFKAEEDNETDLHKKPVVHKCDADTGVSEKVERRTTNSEENVKRSTVSVSCDVASRKPLDEGFLLATSHETEDKQTKDLKIKEASESVDQEDRINVDSYKGKSDSVISLATGVANDVKECAIDRNSVKTSSSRNSVSDLNKSSKVSAADVFDQTKRIEERKIDSAGTNEGMNMVDESGTCTRKDSETNSSDQNVLTGHAIIVDSPKEMRIENEFELIKTSSDKTNIVHCKECVSISDRRSADESTSISVEMGAIEKLPKLYQMIMKESHYVKLGERHAYICVLVKTKLK